MLVSMMISHLGWKLPVGPIIILVFKTFLLTDAASAFVFLSGLTVGIVYGRKTLDSASVSQRAALWARAWLVFKHHAFLVVMVTGLALLSFEVGQQIWIFDSYQTAPVMMGALSLVMATGGWCLDILPMYVLFLLLSPAALWAVTTGRMWLVIGLTCLARSLGQFGFAEMVWGRLASQTGVDTHGISLGLHFNRLSWSALYFGGLIGGTAFVQGKIDLERLKQAKFLPVLLASMALIVGCMMVFRVRMDPQFALYGPVLDLLISKPSLGILSLLNFVAVLFVVCWLLVAGESSTIGSMRMLARGLDRLVRWRPLVFLGQHALPVFTFHLLAIYVFYALVDVSSITVWTAQPVLAIGVLSLFIPAMLSARGRKIKPARHGV